MHNAQTFQPATPAREPNLLLRSDTIFGICEGLGQDFGFNPLWLRVALASGLMWNAAAVVGAYFALGVIVAASRLAFPRPRAVAPAGMVETAGEAAPAAIEAGRDPERELIAA